MVAAVVFGDGPMVTRKDRRHSGRVTPQATISQKGLLENDLFIDVLYDEWTNYRDGFRDWFRDFKKIKNVKDKHWSHLFEKRIRMNKNQKRLLQRRKARQDRQKMRTSLKDESAIPTQLYMR